MKCKDCKYANPIDDHNPDSDVWCNLKGYHCSNNHECYQVDANQESRDQDIRYNSVVENYERGFSQGYDKGKKETIEKIESILYNLLEQGDIQCKDITNVLKLIKE